MFDPGNKNKPMTSEERWISAAFLVLFVGLFAAEMVSNFHPAKLSALLVVLFWVPLLVVHEAGHALVARMLNWHVSQVTLGTGKLIGTFRMGRALIEVRWLLVEGFVRCAPRDMHWPRLKSALIYFWGPGAELLLAVLVAFAVGLDTLFTRSENYALIACQSLVLAAVAQGVLNLVPHAVFTPSGSMPSDGLGIIRSFLTPLSAYDAMVALEYKERENDYDQADWWKREL